MAARKSSYTQRIEMMERVVRLFWPERLVGVIVGICAIGLIFGMGIRSISTGKFDPALVGALLSSGGLIGVACTQTFFIFNRALGVLGLSEPSESKSSTPAPAPTPAPEKGKNA
jgi:hypothetical protein